MIRVEKLRKSYGDFTAVDDISFEARPGEVFGLLGPNGAGKTTTIGCITGLLTPTAGRISVFGHDVISDGVAARRALGVVPQELALYEDLSAEENLIYWGGAQGLRGSEAKTRAQEVLALTGLADRAKEPIKQFSGGMKRRLNFAAGIVHRPRVLVLDEPTVGVDPQSRVRLLELVQEQKQHGTCVIYTTHYMEEAETLCDRLAIVDHGRVIAQGTLDELRAILGSRDLLRLEGIFPVDECRDALHHAEGVEIVQAESALLVLSATKASMRLPEMFAALTAVGAVIHGVTMKQPSLETLFIKLTGKELRE